MQMNYAYHRVYDHRNVLNNFDSIIARACFWKISLNVLKACEWSISHGTRQMLQEDDADCEKEFNEVNISVYCLVFVDLYIVKIEIEDGEFSELH